MWKIVLISLISINSFSQNITKNEAKWCIINYDKVKYYESLLINKDSLLLAQSNNIKEANQIILDNKQEIKNKDYQLGIKQDQINNRQETIDVYKSQEKSIKLENKILKGVIVLLIIVEIFRK